MCYEDRSVVKLLYNENNLQGKFVRNFAKAAVSRRFEAAVSRHFVSRKIDKTV